MQVHPASQWQPPFVLQATLALAGCAQGPGVLIQYSLRGESLDSLLLPAPAFPGPADGLWQRTCFEAFFATRGTDGYAEFNFSPSGQWAAYSFLGERQRDPSSVSFPMPDPSVVNVRRDGAGLFLLASLPLARVPAPPWRLGLTAVLEHMDGRLSYWALQHPLPVPDFHAPGGWVDCPSLINRDTIS